MSKSKGNNDASKTDNTSIAATVATARETATASSKATETAKAAAMVTIMMIRVAAI